MEGNGTIALVLLAAGDSRRFQGNKLLSLWEGKCMYRHVTEEIAGLPKETFFRKVLVTQYDEIALDLEQEEYEIVYNHESSLGISHSIVLALEHLKEEADAVCFSVCDQPWLKAQTIGDFIQSWRSSKKALGCLCYQDNTGNPAIFSRTYYGELLALSGDRGGKGILMQHKDDLYLHQVSDEKELCDIDVQ